MNWSFNPNKTLKKSVLVSGDLYLWKSGDVGVFLGFSPLERRPTFYIVGKLPIGRCSDGTLRVLWGDMYLEYITRNVCRSVIRLPLDREAFVAPYSMPSILCSLAKVYDKRLLEGWLANNGMAGVLDLV